MLLILVIKDAAIPLPSLVASGVELPRGARF
ncbi:MAG: hypothetical protein AW10_02251 [Candidatus Accumulibacter appositus]|uniref:Uncharacterized protein n=1 Tax=Candidatus Accumulibacter appositus TaxID=1454003 RepID=A0A011NWN6_9PROT|nr:MAG: hypothetical protein AW10_02251 [Candidatus Accumulibacter appositus]